MAYRRKTKVTTETTEPIEAPAPKLKANEPEPPPKLKANDPTPPPTPPARPVTTKEQFITVAPVHGDMFEPFQRIAIKGATHVKETNWVIDQLSAGTLRKC